MPTFALVSSAPNAAGRCFAGRIAHGQTLGRDYFLILSTTDQTANDPNVQAFIPSFHFDANADATASARY
jgi:hypothetical protein